MTMIDTADLKGGADRLFQRKRMIAFAVPAIVLAYLVYTFFAFDVPGLYQKASWDNGQKLVADTYSHKVHVTRNNASGDISVAIEGERKGTYAPGTGPDWVDFGADQTVIDMGRGHVVTFGEKTVTYDVPGYGLISATPSRSRGVQAVLPEGDIPDWISLSKARLSVTTDEGRFTVTRTKSEVFNYFFGWELFWFTLDSPYYGHGFVEMIGLALSGDRLDPDRSNLVGMAQDFWNNGMWRHKEVAWAIFETILMAFLGTFGAALVALPLAFLAARNFTPIMPLRFAIRRVLDFVRGVDALIWTIVLSRAFGPGPMTGALAILITDTGTFGKIFSEALENVDEKQIEGLRSTGAKPLQRYRFGVLPQIVPVLLSQVLYFLESNTRSATIIGAITGGGIGLLLTQAIITQKDWEEVSYYIVLIIIMVMVMDWFSGWLRGKLIKGGEGGH
ncbi:MAG: phosphonate ABC transporter, permease protein PhnE [Mangrovicoccus sp.]